MTGNSFRITDPCGGIQYWPVVSLAKDQQCKYLIFVVVVLNEQAVELPMLELPGRSFDITVMTHLWSRWPSWSECSWLWPPEHCSTLCSCAANTSARRSCSRQRDRPAAWDTCLGIASHWRWSQSPGHRWCACRQRYWENLVEKVEVSICSGGWQTEILWLETQLKLP